MRRKLVVRSPDGAGAAFAGGAGARADRTYRPVALRLAFATAVAAVVAACAPGDGPDPRFDPRVDRPAYASDGPRVLFDAAHHNWHRMDRTYRPFVRLLEADGYRVVRGTRPVTTEALRGFDVFVVVTAVGTGERNDDPAFPPDECDTVQQWVAAGGSLLLVTDHYPTGDAVAALAERFGVQLSRGVAEDTTQYDRDFDPTHVVFTRENGGLTSHPIAQGRDASERIERVLSFTGEAVAAPDPAAAFLALPPAAAVRAAQPVVERRGGDIIVTVTYGDPTPAAGWAQGVAVQLGKGRVVVTGEAAMLSAQLRRRDGRPIGMNVPGYDNRQLVLNIMHWLTRVL